MAFVKGLTVGGQTYDVVKTATVSNALTTSMNIAGQSVTVTGVTSTCTVIVAPTPETQSIWTAAGVYCSAQGTNSLTFKAASAPTGNISINVVMLG